MRVPRRRPSRRRRKRAPAISRKTVKRPVAALRRTREAIQGVESQLDALLAALRASNVGITSADDLARAAAQATAALADLGALF